MQNVWLYVLRADAKRILRDRFLLLVTTYLPLMAVFLLSWAVPKLASTIRDKVDLALYYPLIATILALIVPFVMGAVLGIQLLAEKDEKSLYAIAVTPFSFERYVFFRVTIYSFVGAVMLLVSHQGLGIVTNVSFFHMCVLAVAFGLNAPLSALIIAIIAKNQVEGFATMKGSGFLFTAPALSFFIPQHWDLLLGLIPFFWPIKAYYLAASGNTQAFFWLAVVLSFLTQGIALLLLYRIFKRKIFA